MVSDRWRLIEEIFHEALARPSSERGAYVVQACGNDIDLQMEIEALLLNDSGATQAIDSIVENNLHDLSRTSDGSESGLRVGPYQLVRELDSGGMGVVYLAVRSDEQYFQVVAVKMLRTGIHGPGMAQRFRVERQILATLTHPNIGAILDGGETEDGSPYIAMEYVEGQPITQASESRDLSVRERIKLFRSVCSAVHYAHQKLVIHRDIKPSNVLVTPEGTVKLIDFGVSKPLVPELIPEQMPKTENWQRFLTPDYASPEQLIGRELTTATDIYSLGVLLFELLTGSLPYCVAGLSPSATEKLVCDQKHRKPSSVPGLSDRTRRELTGDLDRIVCMAMNPDPSQRYFSAQHLDEDLQRFLEGRPVMAQEPTAIYKLSKFIGRHRNTFLMSCVTIVVCAVSVLLYWWQAGSSARRLKKVEALANSAIVDLTNKLQQSPVSSETQASLFHSALDSLEQLRQNAGEDPRLLLELAQAYQRVGDMESAHLGHPVTALTSYERALKAAIAARSRIPGEETTKAVIEAYQRLGALQFFLGNRAKAEDNYQKSLALAREFWQQQPDEPARKRFFALSYARLGDLQLDNLETDQALSSFRQAFQVFGTEANGDQDHDETLMRLYIRMGGALVEHGAQSDALTNLRESVAVAESLFQKLPGVRQAAVDVFEACNDIVGPLAGTDTVNVGDSITAGIYARKTLAFAKKLAAGDNTNIGERLDLTFAYEAMGDSLRLTQPAAAGRWYRKSISLTRELAPNYPVGSDANQWIAVRDQELAAVLDPKTDATERLQLLEQANGLWKQLVTASDGRPQYRMSLMRNYCRLSDAEAAAGNLTRAREVADSALPFFEEFKPDSPSLLVLRDIGYCYHTMGDVEKRMAGDRSLRISDRQTAKQQARQWYLKSVAVWKEWDRRGAATPESRVEQRKVESRLRALTASGSTSRELTLTSK